MLLCRAFPLLQRTASSSPLRFRAPNRIAIPRTTAHTTVRYYCVEMETVNTSERLAKLRELMKRHNLDVYSKFAASGSYVVCMCVRPLKSPIAMQLYLPKIAINPSISPVATRAEVPTVPNIGFDHVGSPMLPNHCRIYFRFHRFCRNCSDFNHCRRTFHRWTLFQPS